MTSKHFFQYALLDSSALYFIQITWFTCRRLCQHSQGVQMGSVYRMQLRPSDTAVFDLIFWVCYCCLIPLPVCLLHLLICTYINSSPIAFACPTSVLCWCLFFFILTVFLCCFFVGSVYFAAKLPAATGLAEMK